MNIGRYYWGYILSLVLTCAVFGLVWFHYYTGHTVPSHAALFVWILIFALIQLWVQLVCFLRTDSMPQRNTLMLCVAATIVVFIALGSLWIMANLSNNQAIPYDNNIPNVLNEQD